MKIIEAAKDGQLVLEAETQVEVLWLVQVGAKVEIRDDVVIGRVRVVGQDGQKKPAPTSTPVEQTTPPVPVEAPVLDSPTPAPALDTIPEPAPPLAEGMKCPIPACALNHGGVRHYHLTEAGLLVKRRNQKRAVMAKKGTPTREVPDPTSPKAQASEPDSPASTTVSGGSEKTATISPSGKQDWSVVGEVIDYHPPHQKLVDVDQPEPPLEEDEAVLEFQVQPDGRRVSHIPGSTKVVLVELGFREAIYPGEQWRCKLQHHDTYVKAFPIKRVYDKKTQQHDLAVESVAKELLAKPVRPADLPRPVSTPPKVEKPKKFDPSMCPRCGTRMMLQANGSYGHRPQDLAQHQRAVGAQAA